MEPHWTPNSLEDQLAELRAVLIGLHDDMLARDAALREEIQHLRDAQAEMQRTVQELRAALAAHVPTPVSYYSLPEAHRSVPESQPPEPGTE
jgi:hypothetical protein